MARQTIRRWLSIVFDRPSANKAAKEMEEAIAIAGKKSGTNFVREMRAAFDKRMADLKNALARGLIDAKTFKAQGALAARDFNAGIIAGMEKARAAGTLTNTEYLKLSRTLKKVGDDGDVTGNRLVSSMKRVGAAIAAAFSIRELGRFLSGSVKEFGDFDLAMTQSLAIMDDVDEAMRERMVNAARTISKELNLSATEVARGFYFLASAGLTAEQSIAALPVVARFAKAGNFDLARATDLLSDAQSSLGLKLKDTAENMKNLARVSDVLTHAGNLSNATVEQFSEAITNRAGPALRQANKDIEEGVAVLAVFADQGIKGSEAGEQLAIVLRELQRASRENRGEFKRLGINVFETDGSLRSMADIIKELERALGPMSVEMRGATLAQLGFTERSTAGLRALLGTSEAIRGYEVELRKAAGTTQSVADKQMKAFAERWGQVKREVADARAELGRAILRALDLEKNLPRLIALIAVFGRHMGDLVGIVGSLIKAIVLLAGFKGLMGLRAAFIAAESGLAFFRLGIQRLFVAIGPTGWVIIGLTTIIELFRRSGDAAKQAAADYTEALEAQRKWANNKTVVEIAAAATELTKQEKALRAELAELEAEQAKPFKGQGSDRISREEQKKQADRVAKHAELESQINEIIARRKVLLEAMGDAAAAAATGDGGDGGGGTGIDNAKDRGKELEKVEREIAVARLQIAEGLTEALARDAVHRNELLHPQAERTTATAKELEVAWKTLEGLRLAVGFLEDPGDARVLPQQIADVGLQAGSAIPPIQEMTRELFAQKTLMELGVSATSKLGQEIATLAEQQFDNAQKFVTPWTRAMELIQNEVEGQGTLFRELGEAWAEGGIAGLARLAAGKVKENIAQAIEWAAKALGFFALSNPKGAAAAAGASAKHLAAAAAWKVAGAAIGGGGGDSTGGVGGGGTNLKAGETLREPQQDIHVHFVGPGFRATNPVVQEVWRGTERIVKERYGNNVRIITHKDD